MKTTTLGAALQIARSALDDETFAHSLRVAARMNDDIGRTIALLHDVAEDSFLTVDEICKTIEPHPPVIYRALEALTRVPGETYAHYIERIRATGGPAVEVKLADLADHFALADTLKPSLRERYTKALAVLRPDVDAVAQADENSVTLTADGLRVEIAYGPTFDTDLAEALRENQIVGVTGGSCFDFPKDSGVPAGFRNLKQRFDKAFTKAYGHDGR